MKKKIIISLLVLFLLVSIGAFVAVISLKNTTGDLNYLVKMHEVEELRRSLMISIRSVQNDLYTINTPFANNLNTIVRNVRELKELAGKCTACHHPSGLADRIENIGTLIGEYEAALSMYITGSAGPERMQEMKRNAAEIGDTMLGLAGEMSHRASIELESLKSDTKNRIRNVESILIITLTITFIIGVAVVIYLVRSIRAPIKELLLGTRKITSGQFGAQIDHSSDAEFRELATHFNTMSVAIQEGYQKIEKEIEDRMLTENALSKSEKFLTTMFDSIRDPLCILDREFRIVKANEEYCSLLDKKIEDITGKICYEVLHERDEFCENCVVQKTLMSKDPCAQESLLQLKDGTSIWLEVYTYPVFDDNGEVSHAIEYTRDISVRKSNERALRESKERYELAARGANDGLWDWDVRSGNIYYSQRWKSMLGFGENEIRNSISEWIERVHEDDRARVGTELTAHMNGDTPHFESEFRMMNKAGMYHWMLSRGQAIYGPDGKAYRMAGSMTDITERKLAEQQLIFDALHDSLTGLPNRALFMDRLRNAIKRSRRNDSYLYAVLFLDIDRFKVLNDSMGHTVGDKLLVAVSQKLEEILRPGDTVARFGGDEFAIILDDIRERRQALQIAKRIKKKLMTPYELEGQQVFTSGSIGITFSSPEYDDPEQLIRDADIAMYCAKSSGSGRYEIFDKTMYARALSRMQIETDLRQAVKKQEFVLHYQPILSISTSAVIGLEALVRWQHPVRGLVYPSEFIDVAEETGLINHIGEWVLREACLQLKKWQQMFPADQPLTMSVNISTRQLIPNLVRLVRQVLQETSLLPDSLVLEITESLFMNDIDTVTALLSELKALDVQLHIDDFGTGYSSLNYLHRLPIDVLKIDRSFVMSVGLNKENLSIIRAITNLAHSLNMSVIAEGVETEEQLSHIRSLNCEFIQGYLVSRPLDSAKAEELLRQSQADPGRNLSRLSHRA